MFEIEDGKRGFRLYLHHRPDEFGCWVLGKNQLTIDSENGRKTEYKIEKFSGQALVLISSLCGKEYYYRDSCIAVALPT